MGGEGGVGSDEMGRGRGSEAGGMFACPTVRVSSYSALTSNLIPQMLYLLPPSVGSKTSFPPPPENLPSLPPPPLLLPLPVSSPSSLLAPSLALFTPCAPEGGLCLTEGEEKRVRCGAGTDGGGGGGGEGRGGKREGEEGGEGRGREEGGGGGGGESSTGMKERLSSCNGHF